MSGPHVECFACSGEGVEDCPECDGTGVTYDGDGDEYQCGECLGSGVVDCTECEGTGEA